MDWCGQFAADDPKPGRLLDRDELRGQQRRTAIDGLLYQIVTACHLKLTMLRSELYCL